MDPERLRMMGDHVLLRVESRPDRVGTIHLPDGAMETSTGTARVLSVGPGRPKRKKIGRDQHGKPILVPTGEVEPLDVKPGDRVALLWHHLHNMRIADDLAVVSERDLWGVLE